MTEVNFDAFKMHLLSFNTVMQIKYIDGVRYYFNRSKLVAKMSGRSYFILKKQLSKDNNNKK